MYVISSVPRPSGARIVTFVLAIVAATLAGHARAYAQATTPQHDHTAAKPGEQHAGHDAAEMAREGSGTSWLPDRSPMYAIHATRGTWTLMFHENAFLQYLHESGDRGADQLGSINWLMGMARRDLGAGHLGVRGMFSLEPWSIRGCGYPDLLATGEQCQGEQIHDRQHPHDLFMELAATYDAPLARGVRWQVYGGPAGEPALGPVAYPHRVSAMPNPLAPISHHWLDSTHITYGVATGAVYGKKWKAEASVFNGREPDDDRTGFDFGAMSSVSGRLWVLPSPRLALQVSAGRLDDAETGEEGEPRVDVNRVTASAMYHGAFREHGVWATTVGWGRNAASDHASNALLIETSVTLAQRDTWFGRFEVAGKSAHDLAVAEPPSEFTVSKLQGGYTRYLSAWSGFQPGLGAALSIGIVPETLQPAYGSRANIGFAVYVTLRPAAFAHASASSPAQPATPHAHGAAHE
jgi:hypothetical protein